jgi:uncharacterized protein (TIGR03437 family)
MHIGLKANAAIIRGLRPFATPCVLGLFWAALLSADTLQLVVSNETVPAGATAQIKVFLATPKAVSSGRCFMSLDPAVFGDIIQVMAFSATGDIYGAPTVQGRVIDMKFNSDPDAFPPSYSAGVGRLPGLPVFVVTVPVLPGVLPGTKTSISLDPSPQPWDDAQGNPYTVSVTPGTLTVGGSLSIGDVSPGGGRLPVGTAVRVTGTGFVPTSVLSVDGVGVASVQVLSANEIDFVTSGGPVEMTGKRVHVSNPDGGESTYFAFLPAEVPFGPAPPRRVIFPLREFTAVSANHDAVIQNANLVPVDVTVVVSPDGFTAGPPQTFTLAPGAVAGNFGGDSPQRSSYVSISATGPFRAVGYAGGAFTPDNLFTLQQPIAVTLPVQAGTNTPYLQFAWKVGAAPPAAQTFAYSCNDNSATLNVSSATESGHWLSVTSAVQAGGGCAVSLVASVNSSSLVAGSYFGTITVSPSSANGIPGVTQVRLDVFDGIVYLAPQNFLLEFEPADTTSYAYSLSLSKDLFFPPLSASGIIDGGGNWFSVGSVDSVKDEIPVTVSFSNAPGLYSGEILVNSAWVVAAFPIIEYIPNPLLYADVLGIWFAATLNMTGSGAPTPVTVNVTGGAFSASAVTNSGGSWMGITQAASSVTVKADPSGLAAGIYTGVVTLTPASGAGPTQLPVVLVVTKKNPARLLAIPPSLAFSGQTLLAISFDTGLEPAEVTTRAVTLTGGNWLSIPSRPVITTPGWINVTANPASLAAGVYYGSILASTATETVTIPVTLTITAPLPTGPPVIGSVVSAASGLGRALAPGEIISIYGTELGPHDSTFFHDTQVLFDGVAGPVLYAAYSQVNVVVPPGIAGQSTTAIQLVYDGFSSSPAAIPVVPAVPGLFTLSGSGRGQAAVLNQDNSVNDAANPAAPGSVIQIFGTGAGESGQPVGVSIGGVDSTVLFSGQAPGEVAGLFQVNAVVPGGAAAGPGVPLVVKVGNSASQMGATIAVK